MGALALAAAPAHAASLDVAFTASGARLNAVDTPRWTGVMARADRDMRGAAVEDCARPASPKPGTRPAKASAGSRSTHACGLAGWTRKLSRAGDLSLSRQVEWVHRSINALPYVSDSERWGQADRWESPAEMFAAGGDCEGFALTKYFSLRALGVSDDAMRVAVVWDAVDREEHAILLVRMAGEVWFLDNKMDAPERAADHAGRYRLIYYLNESGVRLPEQPSMFQRASAPRARLTDGGRTLVLQTRPRTRSQLLGQDGGGLDRVGAVMPAGR